MPLQDEQPAQHDARLERAVRALARIRQGDYRADLPPFPDGVAGQLEGALAELAHTLEARAFEQRKLDEITAAVNAGLLLDEVLDKVYESFHGVIPYNRIGFSLIEEDGQSARAVWARTDREVVRLEQGYTAPLAGSSLQQIIETGQPRILNDLEAYHRSKPTSESTALILDEGLRASLTCPLIANGVPIGFMFFSSIHPGVYTQEHAEVFRKIAAPLAVIVEKARLASMLAEQKQAIEQQNAELVRLNRLKNVFLGMAAHDLRSPIANIQIIAQVLIEMGATISDAERASLLRDVRQQTQYMLTLISQLLDVTEIEAGQLALDIEPVDVTNCLAETVERHHALASHRNVRVELRPVGAGKVLADRVRLRQILDNLLSNAVKFSPAGAAVIVRARRQGDQWWIGVQDRGPGISHEEHQKLFEYFGRISTRPASGEKSTGLGLAITRKAVEAHGGEIGVESAPGAGSTFWFTLPAAPED